MFGAKAQIAPGEGRGLQTIMVSSPLAAGYSPTPEVLRINPKADPALVDGDVEIFDSTQIFEFLEDRSEPPLWPQVAAARRRGSLTSLLSTSSHDERSYRSR
jgi:glutathione S-transferase